MKAKRKVSESTPQNEQWIFDTELYNRSLQLTDAEKAEINLIANKNSKWYSKSHKVLERLLRPLNDVLTITKAIPPTRKSVVRVIIREMNLRSSSFWAWKEQEWREIFSSNQTAFSQYYQVPGDCRSHLIAIVYLLCGFHTHRPGSTGLHSYSVAVKVFGKELVDKACDRVFEAYLSLGYGQDRAKGRLKVAICEALLANRSPYIEDLTVEFLEDLRRGKEIPNYIRPDLVAVSFALTSLGIITKPLKPLYKEGERFGVPDALTDVPTEWQDWCKRWHDTSTLATNSRQRIYYHLIKIGRWLVQEYSDVVSPEEWSRDLAIQFVAAVDKMKVGQYVNYKASLSKKLDQPLSPRGKDLLLNAARTFFKDCQEWNWLPRCFNPDRVLATPRSVRALIGPNPRVIADDIWAKLLWAGLNLAEEDLPHPAQHEISWYPLEMVKAIVIVWLFAGLRRNEISRLRVGCVRWQKNDVILTGTNEVVPKDAVCYLDVPVHKTGTAYTKPVDRIVGEAITQWELVRPNQASTIDSKDGSIAYYLFFHRGRRIGETYINKSIIPMLCSKAGVPTLDSRGNITSHRARSTIASQLANAKEPMTLLELKEWLGHRDVSSTINYTKVSPTKLASSYKNADYFQRNIRTVEVLIDQDAIKTGAAASGEPWRFYDLGHGYCTYDFFDQCKHRMACAKCNFYVTKDSSQAQILESKANLQRMLQEIPLTDEERAAVEDGIEAMEKLSAKLADVPTPSGEAATCDLLCVTLVDWRSNSTTV